MAQLSRKKIWCVEGKWGKFTDTTSVKPVLDLLEKTKPYAVKSHRSEITTMDSLKLSLTKWLQKGHRDYKILYIACHGDCGSIHPVGSGKKNEITLEWFREVLAGKCHNRIIFFASCATMSAGKRELKKFLRETKALAVCGYKNDVDWLKATAFEMLVLAEMQFGGLTKPSMAALLKRIKTETGKLSRELEFEMVVRE